METVRRVFLARPRGFCSGVKRALEMVSDSLAKAPGKVFVLHEIVHNEHVVEMLKRNGAVFIDAPEDAPSGTTIIFSAHGVSGDVEGRARALGLDIVDATCPLVKAVHRKAAALESEGFDIILIGHKSHREIVGVMGRLSMPPKVVESLDDAAHVEDSGAPCACLTQTTLSGDDVAGIVAELKKRVPSLNVAGGVCYATRDRQAAVKSLAGHCKHILVVGSQKSSNSRRLKEVAESAGAKAWLIDSAAMIPNEILESGGDVGISSGASAPEGLVQEALDLLLSKGFSFGGEIEDGATPRTHR